MPQHSTPALAKTLSEGRARIDALDVQLLEILRKRWEIVRSLAEAKRLGGMPMHDPGREASLIASREGDAQRLGLPAGLACEIFEGLVAAFRRAGEKL
jgi:chorismate mutase